MAKKIIYITESQKKKIFEQEQFMLSEDKNSDYLKKLIKTYSSEMIKPYLETKVSELPNEYKNHFQQADGRLFDSCVQNNANLLMFLRLQFLKHFDISHGKGPIEFIPGLGRIGIAELGFFNEYANQSDISLLKQLVLFIHTNKELFDTEINSDLNGWDFSQLKEHVNQKRKEFNLKNKEKLSNSYNQGQSHYTVVPINSQEEARKYAPYTTWCVTDNAYSSYAHDGARFYFCLRDGFENVKKEVGEGCPLDEYGLSMVSILVDMEGEPTYVTTRWNHQHDGENNENFRTAEQVQNILGINFYQTFKPYTREELHAMGIVLFDEVQGLLDSGKEPEEIFDWVGSFNDGLAKVQLNKKWNFINTEGKFIGDKWFDWADIFYNGFARVKLNEKFNFINTEGKIISDAWFGDANNFFNGFAKVKLNGKWNFINTEGKFIGDTWFDIVVNFYGGFARVGLNKKYNFINTEGKLISNAWFDDALDFNNGFAKVKLNRKFNFINTDGKLISDVWFDRIGDFHDGFAKVRLNGKDYKLDRKGNLYVYSTGELVKKATLQESHKTLYITESQLSEIKKKHKKKSAQEQVGGYVNSGILQGITGSGMMGEGAEPESDKYHIAGEGGNNEYFHAVNESPDTVGFFGKHFRDADALAFIKLKCDGKLHFANQNGIRHIDIINELEKRGEIEHIDFDELPYSEFAYEVETGRYWMGANVISCWGMPTTKQEISEFSNLIYDIEDYLRKKIDRKTLYVDMWKRRNGGTCVIPYSWLFNGVWEMLRSEVMSVIPKTEDKNAFLVRKLDRSEFIMYRNGDMLSTDEYKEKVLQSDRVALAEGLSSKGYDFKKDMKSILDFMREEGLNVYPYPKVKLDWEEQDGLFIRTGYYEPETKTVVVFCKDRHPKDILRSAAHEFIHHAQNLDGKDLNFSANDDVKDNERLEKIEAEAYLKGNIYFRKWTEHKHNKEMLQEGKKVVNDKGKTVPEKCDKCGGDVVVQIHGEPVYICKDCGKYFGTMPFPENLNEELETEITSDEVDLSSFNIKHHLNPKFWKDGHLDSRIRLKLLDVSDDFIESLSVDWAKPKDVIITGSIANFNWSKEYSDIDLHVLYDFSDIDENVEFVKEYFDSKKKIWNEEHKDLNVYGFPVEVYVQDANEKHASSGVYSLDKNEWIIEPEREKLANAKVNKEYIREKVAKYVNLIDLLNEKFEEADGDEYKTRKVREKAEKLFKAIKAERTKEFDRGKGEISNGNIIFKTLRRMDYIGILMDIKRRCYDTLNSL